MTKRSLFALIAVLAFGLAYADEYHVGKLQIDHAHARPTVPGQSSGALYLSVENRGNSIDRLLTISTPVAKSAEVHSMQMDGNIMRMREVGSLELKPAARVDMGPGDGYHIMLIDLKQALKSGQKIPLTLRFEKAGVVEISAIVDSN